MLPSSLWLTDPGLTTLPLHTAWPSGTPLLSPFFCGNYTVEVLSDHLSSLMSPWRRFFHATETKPAPYLGIPLFFAVKLHVAGYGSAPDCRAKTVVGRAPARQL